MADTESDSQSDDNDDPETGDGEPVREPASPVAHCQFESDDEAEAASASEAARPSYGPFF